MSCLDSLIFCQRSHWDSPPCPPVSWAPPSGCCLDCCCVQSPGSICLPRPYAQLMPHTQSTDGSFTCEGFLNAHTWEQCKKRRHSQKRGTWVTVIVLSLYWGSVYGLTAANERKTNRIWFSCVKVQWSEQKKSKKVHIFY